MHICYANASINAYEYAYAHTYTHICIYIYINTSLFQHGSNMHPQFEIPPTLHF